MREALHRAVRLGSQMLPAAEITPCLACGEPLVPGTRYCPSCGASQQGSSRQLPAVGRLSAAQEPWIGDERSASALDTEGAAGARAARTRAEARAQSPEIFTTLQRRLRKEHTVRFRLVGRGEAIRSLDSFFSSELRVAEVLGPVGSGRTRILEAAGEMARGKGLQVVYAGADPGLSPLPWYPVQQLARSLLGLGDDPVTPEGVREAVLRSGLLAGDVPGAMELFGISALGGQVEHAVRRREAYGTVRRLVREGAQARGGLCLVLDDLDEYDGATRLFVADLVEKQDERPVYAVVASEKSLLAPESARLSVELCPLAEAAVEAILADALDPKSSSWRVWVRTVLAASEGLPFHVEQAARLLADGGSEADAPLADVVSMRLGRLPADAVRLLQAVSVFGREALDRWATTLYSGGSAWQEAATLLCRRGWLRQEGHLLRVGHPYLAEAVRAATPADVRQSLHRRALEVLREEGASTIHCAAHAREARIGEEALDVLRSAGNQAESWLDDVGAARFYREALQMARYDLLYDPDHDEVLELEARLIDTLRFSGDLVGAEMVLRDAEQGARHRPSGMARLLRSRAQVLLARDEQEEAVVVMREAVRQAIFAGSPELLSSLYIDLGKLLLARQRFEEAVAELEEGVAMVTAGEGATSAAAPQGFWRLLLYLSEAHLKSGSRDTALSAAAAALGQAERTSSVIGQARSHFLLAQVLEALGRVDAADQHRDAALSAFRRLGDRRSAAECLIDRAGHRPAERDRLLEEARNLAAQVGWAEAAQPT